MPEQGDSHIPDPPPDSSRFGHLHDVVLIAGLSGAGKSTASKVLSDLGYYTIDNLPTELLKEFLELSRQKPEKFSRLCLLLDIGSLSLVDDFLHFLTTLRESVTTRVVFLDCVTEVLVRRYSETRRPHPAFEPSRDRSLTDTVQRERSRLIRVKEQANYVVDTSNLTVHDLRRELTSIVGCFAKDIERVILVNFISFGFKYGTPVDCDLLVDVRFIPNPYFIDSLRDQTGLDEEVAKYVLENEKTAQFLKKYSELLRFLLPQYAYEGKAYLNVGIGCTGGKHRSVAIAGALSKEFSDNVQYRIGVKHRDLTRH